MKIKYEDIKISDLKHFSNFNLIFDGDKQMVLLEPKNKIIIELI